MTNHHECESYVRSGITINNLFKINGFKLINRNLVSNEDLRRTKMNK